MSDELKIEHGIPIPSRRNKHSIIGVLKQLGIGDSIFIANKTTNLVSGQAQYAGFKAGYKFTCRKEGTGVRIWRTE